MDIMQKAIDERAFTDDERAVINERLGRIAGNLSENEDARILDAALSSLDNLRAFAAMRKMPAVSSGKTTIGKPAICGPRPHILTSRYTATLERARAMR